MRQYLRQYNQYQRAGRSPGRNRHGPRRSRPARSPAHEPEFFANDVSQLLDYLIAEAGKQVGKPVEQMHREDKIKFVRYLDQKGAFLITKAAERIYEYLGVSRFTLYNYLDIVRKETNAGAPPQEESTS